MLGLIGRWSGGCGSSLVYGDIALTAAHVSPAFFIYTMYLFSLQSADTLEIVVVRFGWVVGSQCIGSFLSGCIVLFFVENKSGPRDDGGRIQVGATERGSTSDGSIFVHVRSLHEHPDFEDITEEYDYMVLKLDGWVSSCFSPSIYPHDLDMFF